MELVNREEWGARDPVRVSRTVRKHRVKVHWTVTCVSEEATLRAEVAHLRGLQADHMDNNGWNDIAYNFVIFPSGRVYEGRGLNVRSAANGGRVTNYGHQAVALVSAPTCEATTRQFDSLGLLINRDYALDVRGHRDGAATSCPGDEIYEWVQAEGWKDLLREKGPSFWSWKAWRCSYGPWEGLGRKEHGATYRPRIPRRLSPKWVSWFAKFRASGGCKRRGGDT